jgi:hypothetical protein
MYQDIIDVRDIIDEYEQILDTRDPETGKIDPDEQENFDQLTTLLGDLKGYGGDHQWQGDWYPVTLISDSHFTEYAIELADGIGATNSEMSWPYTCIDWEQAANELQIDYTSVEYDGTTYWYR